MFKTERKTYSVRVNPKLMDAAKRAKMDISQIIEDALLAVLPVSMSQASKPRRKS